jgi:hypothetical protein
MGIMSNRILRLGLYDRALSPMGAELWVVVETEQVTDTTEVRGRLAGPQSAHAATIEVAYPLRPFPKHPDGLPPMTRRVVIPDPGLWSPQTPFLYQGTVELWEDGQMCDRAPVRYGVRVAQLARDGLRWNGKLIDLRMVERVLATELELRRLHSEGINGLLIPAEADSLWEMAERLGFITLGQLGDAHADIERWSSSPCCLGWVVPAEACRDWPAWQARVAPAIRRRRVMGMVGDGDMPPPEIDFVIGSAAMARDRRPCLLRPANPSDPLRFGDG